MAPNVPLPDDFTLARPQLHHGRRSIPGPTFESFTASFGDEFPRPQYLDSEYGRTAVYDLASYHLFPEGDGSRKVLLIHGLNTPALGMLPLARDLKALDPDAHIATFDLWGHGLSSTPLVPHTPSIFHAQILQVLSYMRWERADIVGYSFGGSLATGFALPCPWTVSSVVLTAPAGLFSVEPELQQTLDDVGASESTKRQAVLDWLEGGPLTVPEDWQAKAQRGEVVAEALRAWELKEHSGYSHSVLSIFRDGGARGREEAYKTFAKLPVRNLSILGATDPVCSPELLIAVGLTNITVVADVGHDLVRSKSVAVAQLIHDFWLQQN